MMCFVGCTNTICHSHRKEMYTMNDAQFYGVFIALLIIMAVVEIGMLSICDYLKKIKRLLEKYVNQEPPKGE